MAGPKSKIKPKAIALAFKRYHAGKWSKVKCAVYLDCSKSNVSWVFKRYELNKRLDEIIREKYDGQCAR